MGNLLQDPRTAAELASLEQVIEITDKISSFGRLANIVDADLAALDSDKIPSDWRDGAIRGELRFGFADVDGSIPKLTGSATAVVEAVCQRCLEPFSLKLRIEPELLLLQADDAAEGYDDHEVWELDEQSFKPQDIVEELLIMAMPLAAMHGNVDECKALVSTGRSKRADSDDSEEDLVRPFAALRKQMTQNEKDPD